MTDEQAAANIRTAMDELNKHVAVAVNRGLNVVIQGFENTTPLDWDTGRDQWAPIHFHALITKEL